MNYAQGPADLGNTAMPLMAPNKSQSAIYVNSGNQQSEPFEAKTTAIWFNSDDAVDMAIGKNPDATASGKITLPAAYFPAEIQVNAGEKIAFAHATATPIISIIELKNAGS
ncbi:MAG: hypothetical protein C0608_00015 [Deltaproteobacteria bacterium]|nr:MAG: hypothetical protein C0608_00015 [Deltaproteobacteria bacterium]